MFFFNEHAAEEWMRTERLEEAGRDEGGRQAFGRAVAREINAALLLDEEEAADRLGELACRAEIEEVRLRVRASLDRSMELAFHTRTSRSGAVNGSGSRTHRARR